MELARSISEIEMVISARVHLAIPEKEVFIRDTAEPLHLYSFNLLVVAALAEVRLKQLSILFHRLYQT